VLGVPQMAEIRHHGGGNGTQPRDNLSCIIEPAHMRIAGGENAIWVWSARIVLDREKQFRHCLIKSPSYEMCITHYTEQRADPGAWAQAEGHFLMLDCNVGLARPNSNVAADVPATPQNSG
jgi:hypothetical protein